MASPMSLGTSNPKVSSFGAREPTDIDQLIYHPRFTLLLSMFPSPLPTGIPRRCCVVPPPHSDPCSLGPDHVSWAFSCPFFGGISPDEVGIGDSSSVSQRRENP